MPTGIFVPDPFLIGLFKWSTRGLAVSAAIGVLAFVISIVFRAIALMVDTANGALHSIMALGQTLSQIYAALGMVGQGALICILLPLLLMIIYRGCRFLVSAYRGGTL